MNEINHGPGQSQSQSSLNKKIDSIPKKIQLIELVCYSKHHKLSQFIQNEIPNVRKCDLSHRAKKSPKKIQKNPLHSLIKLHECCKLQHNLTMKWATTMIYQYSNISFCSDEFFFSSFFFPFPSSLFIASDVKCENKPTQHRFFPFLLLFDSIQFDLLLVNIYLIAICLRRFSANVFVSRKKKSVTERWQKKKSI